MNNYTFKDFYEFNIQDTPIIDNTDVNDIWNKINKYLILYIILLVLISILGYYTYNHGNFGFYRFWIKFQDTLTIWKK
jgi:hypothetical protein